MFLIVPYVITVAVFSAITLVLSVLTDANPAAVMAFVFVVLEIVLVPVASVINGKVSEERRKDKACAVWLSVINGVFLALSIILFAV